jgi:hypothetical protein
MLAAGSVSTWLTLRPGKRPTYFVTSATAGMSFNHATQGTKTEKLAPLHAFRYRAATRVDTLGGNAAEGNFPRIFQGTFRVPDACM